MNLKKKLAPLILMGASTLILCTTSSYAQNGTITGDTVRLREEPNTSSKIVTNLDKDDTVEVLEKSGEWYKVKYKEDNGYVYGEYLKVSGTLEENTKDDNKKENTNENEKNNNEIKVNSTIKVKSDSKLHVLPLIHSEQKINVKKDSDVLVLQVTNNWVYVTYENTNGWIVKKDLAEEIKQKEEPKQEEQQQEAKETSTNETKTRIGYVNVESANIREVPTTDSEPLTALTLNTEVTIIGEENNWYKIQLGDKQVYIYSKLVSDEKTVKETSRASTSDRTTSQEDQNTVQTSNKSVTGAEIVEYAKQFLGYKYVSGGNGPNSFDCSGFTKYVYGHFGYSLDRTTGDQAKNGVKVEKSDLQEGDLLIFLNDSKSSIGHVGIYIGDGRFIHAANPSRGVVTDSVSNSYYQPRYVTARRII